jgi:hypothetical protein
VILDADQVEAALIGEAGELADLLEVCAHRDDAEAELELPAIARPHR